MTVTIEASNGNGVPINVTKTYLDVTANQHYNISIEQASASSFSLNVTLGDEIIINDIITFPN